MRSFVKKTGMPEGKREPNERPSWESFGKIEAPRKGQNASDTKKPTLRQTAKKALL